MSPKVEYSEEQRIEIAARTAELIVAPFPTPGGRVINAFKEMEQLASGSTAHRTALNNGKGLPRPWSPATCKDRALREELFEWLDEVVMWLNQQYTWDTAMMIPPCWLWHPHIVNEVAVVAARRRVAEDGYVTEALEIWHHQDLPEFFERMRTRLGHACDDGEHAPWPGNPRYRSYIGAESRAQRTDRVASDLCAQERLDQIEAEALANAEAGE